MTTIVFQKAKVSTAQLKLQKLRQLGMDLTLLFQSSKHSIRGQNSSSQLTKKIGQLFMQKNLRKYLRSMCYTSTNIKDVRASFIIMEGNTKLDLLMKVPNETDIAPVNLYFGIHRSNNKSNFIFHTKANILR